MRRLLQPGDVVVDVGAFVGLFTLLAAAAVGSRGQVHAFEPVPQSFDRLQANVAANALSQVRLNRSAVGAHEGMVTLGLEGPEVPGFRESAAFYTVGGAYDATSAPLLSLDLYVADQLEGRHIRLLKIDAEGSEPDVLSGLTGTLANVPPDIVMMEVNVLLLKRRGRTVADVLDPLQRHGYALHRPGYFRRLPGLNTKSLKQASWGERLVQRDPESLLIHIARSMLGRRSLVNLVALKGGVLEGS